MRQPRTHRGELREKVIIKSVTLTSDGQGGSTEALSAGTTVWAKVTPLTGSRALEYEQVAGAQGSIITINFRDDITIDNTSILSWDSKTLTVHSAKTTEDRRQIEILAFNKI